MINNDEKKLRKTLKRETDVATDQKDETWNKIEGVLFPKKNKKPWGRRIAVGIGTVAAAFLLIIISTSILTNERAGEQHQPLEQNEHSGDEKNPGEKNEQPSSEVKVPLKDQYDDEIQREREPEGQLEVVDMKLAVNEDEKYIMYVNKEDYTFEITNGHGRVNFTKELDDMYPEVGMTIHQHTNTTKDDLMNLVKEEITTENMAIIDEETISYPFDAHAITAQSNENPEEWNNPLHMYYIYKADEETYFLFKQMLFMEAWGGHDSIFDFMLETFEYVPDK